MKKIVLSTVILLVLSGMAHSQGRFWKVLGNFATSVGAAALDVHLQGLGYSSEESHNMISDFSSAVGLDSHNVDNGMAFVAADKKEQYNMMADAALDAAGELTGRQDITGTAKKVVDAGFDVSNADNNYEKGDIIAGAALDAVGDLTGRHDVTDRISTYVNNELTYRSDISKAETVDELQEAIDKKGNADRELFYDVGMALYDYREKKNKSTRVPATNLEPSYIEPYPDEPNGGEITIAPHEDLPEVSLSEIQEEQQASDSSEHIESAETLDVAQKESASVADVAEEVVTSEVPQEREVVPSGVSQEEESVFEKNEYSVVAGITDKQKPEYIQEIKSVSLEFETSEPAGKNMTDEPIEPRVKECGVGGYPFNSTELSEESKKELDKLYDILAGNVDLHIKITGHTCDIGTEAVNFRVGLERAKRWKEYLVWRGVSQDRVVLDSKGATQPRVANTSSENRETNRRVEIDVLSSPKEEESIRMQVERLVQFYAPRTFRVQIMATSKPIENYDSVFIMGYDIYDPMEEEVGYVKGKEVYRYVSDEMRSRKEAKALRDDFAKRGFRDAWIVEYKGGTRVSL